MKKLTAMMVMTGGLMLMHGTAWAQMCRAYQVTCAPGLGMLEVRHVYYNRMDSTDGCVVDAQTTKKLAEQKIYPLRHEDYALPTASCDLPHYKVKVESRVEIENKNELGPCGGNGPIAVVTLWIDGKMVAKEIPLESCNMSWDVRGVTLSEQYDRVQFIVDGHVRNDFFELDGGKVKEPITRRKIEGKEK